MQMIYKSTRYVLPVLFLGYGAYANVNLLASGAATLAGKTDILRGEVTAQIDHLYKSDLPHRNGSVGLVGAARYLLTGEGRTGVLTGRDGWLFTSEEARAMGDDMTGEVARIVAVRDQLKAAGVELVIVPVPAKADIEADKANRPDLTAEMVDRYVTFRADLADVGIRSVDSRTPLAELNDREQAFFATDTHWTVDGARVVADAVGHDLIAAGLVANDATFKIQLENNLNFTGDLVSFVTSDTWAPAIGLAPESVTPFLSVAEASAELGTIDLFGGADSGGVVLVGTSYSANARWSFAESLKVALGSDVINFAKEGQGPARPMFAYLKSADFRDAPPAVVIWEFPVRYLADPTIWDEQTKPAEGEDAT